MNFTLPFRTTANGSFTQHGVMMRKAPSGKLNQMAAAEQKSRQKSAIILSRAFSPDGSKIVYHRIGGDSFRGTTYTKDRGIYWVPSSGGTSTLITEEGDTPKFNKTGDRIFLISGEGDKTALISVGLSGQERRVHLLSDNAQEIALSPDEKWVAFVERFNAYVAVFPTTGQAVNISPSTSDYPVKRITRDAGTYMHWSPDSKTVHWSLGPELFSPRPDEYLQVCRRRGGQHSGKAGHIGIKHQLLGADRQSDGKHRSYRRDCHLYEGR